MGYHQDRFQDFSLMIFQADKLIAVLPANKRGNELFSHQGLTFGGLLLGEETSAIQAQYIINAIMDYLKANEIETLTVKKIPEFYCTEPADELENHLLKNRAETVITYKVLAIDYSEPLTIHKTKLKRFRNNKFDFKIEETNQFTGFWNTVLIPRLQDKHGVKPVHSLDEIMLLNKRFPKQIKQFNISLNDEILAGITIFENERVVKSQYGATTAEGEKTRALDYLFLHLIFKYQTEGKQFFSMGTVTDTNKIGYNPGLLKQKKELGCKMYYQPVYKLKL